LKCKGQGNADKAHLEPIEDTKREPYKTKGYTQDIRIQKPKQALKKKNFLAIAGTREQWWAWA
jgi:hypothetical protein